MYEKKHQLSYAEQRFFKSMLSSCGTEILEIYAQQRFGTPLDMYTEQKFLKSMRSSWGTEIFEIYAQQGLLNSLRYIYGTEILGRKAFLQGKNYQDQLNVIFQVVGPPSEKDLEVCNRWSLLWVCVGFFSCHFPDGWVSVWKDLEACICRPLLFGALLRICGSLLRICSALLRKCGSLFWIYRALW